MALPTLRDETEQLVRLAERDLSALWRLIADGAPTDEALHDLLPTLVTEYGAAGATVAAEWYDEQREAAGASGRFVAAPVAAGDRGAHALVGWALTEAVDDDSLRTLILGGVQRRVADHLRMTVVGNSIADRAARGWMRVGHGECDWCQQYIDGEVRYVAGYDFPAHDWCRCDAIVAF